MYRITLEAVPRNFTRNRYMLYWESITLF